MDIVIEIIVQLSIPWITASRSNVFWAGATNIFRPDTEIPWDWAQLEWTNMSVQSKETRSCLVFGTHTERSMYYFGYSPCK